MLRTAKLRYEVVYKSVEDLSEPSGYMMLLSLLEHPHTGRGGTLHFSHKSAEIFQVKLKSIKINTR